MFIVLEIWRTWQISEGRAIVWFESTFWNLCICYRADADTFSESVVSLDVVVEFFHSLSSQGGAVVGFIHIQQRCNGVEDSQSVMGVIHTGREILMEKHTQQVYISTPKAV